MRPKKVIMCVDANEEALSIRVFLLDMRGYRVLTAETSQEALEMLEKTIPGTLDLLIADLLLPEMDGNELCRRAKQMHPLLPCLITSGTVSSYDRTLASDSFLPAGCCGAADLLDRIRIMVARRRGPKRHFPVPTYLEVRAREIAVAAAERDKRLSGGEAVQSRKAVEEKVEVVA